MKRAFFEKKRKKYEPDADAAALICSKKQYA